jgi:Asp-tRNA(Asn)/Glu-tRNA(Gln) amidotransferase A subunit family amidase
MSESNRLSAAQAAARLARGEITAEALLRDCLARVDAREPIVRAWQFLDREHALAQARSLDRGPVRGPLHGIPVGVKDVFDTHDMPTEHGSPIYKGHRPVADAAVVALTRRAGGLVMGKTVTTEFATFHPGPTRNPHDPAHTPGGSSSGSAAAVADFMAALAFGTQTAGSIIRPASFCGVVGYKPTYNTLPRAGFKPDADTLDTVGVLARTVEDAALFVAALAGRPELRSPPAAPARIGLCRTYEWHRSGRETVAAVENAASRLSASGARVRDLQLPTSFAGLLKAQITVMWYEVARSLADEFTRHPEQLSAQLRERCEKGYACDPAEYAAAIALGRDCRARLADAFGDCDVLLAPAAPGEAPKGEATGDPVMNQVWTFLHVPCITVPAAKGPNGLPVGVQIVGRIGDDARTLAAAQWVEGLLKKE